MDITGTIDRERGIFSITNTEKYARTLGESKINREKINGYLKSIDEY